MKYIYLKWVLHFVIIFLTNIHYFSVSIKYPISYLIYLLKLTISYYFLCSPLIILHFCIPNRYLSELNFWNFMQILSVMIGSPLHICINEASHIQMLFVLCFRPKRNTRRALMSSASARRSTWRTWRWCLSSASSLRRRGWTSSARCFWTSNAILTSPRAKGQLEITNLFSLTRWSFFMNISILSFWRFMSFEVIYILVSCWRIKM